MKKLLLCTGIIFALLSQTHSQNFYDLNTVQKIEIFFTQSNWDYLMKTNYNLDNNQRLLCTVKINGTQYDSVGVRYKGYSSYNENEVKKPLNIKLDHIKNNQNIEGYGTIKLSNAYKDPSFVREVLGYDIASKYTPVPKANFAEVYINDTLIGLYTNVQSIDKEFLRQHFCYDEGPLFKGMIDNQFFHPCCAPGKPIIWGYDGQDTICYTRYFEKRSEADWNELINFLDTFNNYQSNIENVLNIDRLIWMMAFDNITVNLDAPINVSNNYYLYKDASQRFNTVIWDLNMAFGGMRKIMNPPQVINLNNNQLKTLDPFLNINNPNFPIIKNILQEPGNRKKYIAHLKTIMNENFVNGSYLTRASDIQNIISNHVQADSNKFFSYSDFNNNLNYTSVMIIGLSELMSGRTTFLQNHPLLNNTPPSVNNVVYPSTSVYRNSNISITAEVNLADNVIMGYRFSNQEAFNKMEMYDDGNHNDGIAGDKIYGATLTIGSGDMDFYIYAENDSAGIFSPERAEYEFYTVDVLSDVVINEFMASNNNTVQDQNGEYDDWIELYNNSNSAISLNGYYLSDKAGEPDKWMFPDTTIGGNSYLIIWADKDEAQYGLHCNFKLSAAGEAIYLSNNNEVVIDDVVFGQQITDSTFGRYPNGTGSFIQLYPTFFAENIISTGVKEINYNINITIYPNPANNNVIIELDDFEPVEIEVYDIHGKLTYNRVIRARAKINVADWNPGIYMVKVGDIAVRKLIVL